jgi:hypothetical protein
LLDAAVVVDRGGASLMVDEVLYGDEKESWADTQSIGQPSHNP